MREGGGGWVMGVWVGWGGGRGRVGVGPTLWGGAEGWDSLDISF